ncbi:hypothetical protein DQ238_02870 [Geodermatophilus sp. TF02-6]|uniref:hypothetical protein n=1 Tax=Geodermatophilus sp. TF02-6 TaxID=2250575 RepID=UPI000DE8A38F|nr:hypothetical protein [Geodermatophilus sp. TF02-6]RBY82955.1 hypothetical protein DQ238_02870 [Geodermatophilus sp. TF02-6]
MPFVLVVDGRGGRRGPGRVDDVLRRLADRVPSVASFAWTAQDELQGVLTDADAVVDVVLGLAREDAAREGLAREGLAREGTVREAGWSIGVGAGAVPDPPEGAPAGAGSAFLCARRALDAARHRSTRLAVRGAVPPDAADAQAVLTALAVVVARRSGPAWEAVELVGAGRTQAGAAAALGISRQAVGQRLAAGLWELERELRPTAARLLTRAAG